MYVQTSPRIKQFIPPNCYPMMQTARLPPLKFTLEGRSACKRVFVDENTSRA